MIKLILLFLLFIQFSFSQIKNESSAGIAYRYGSVESTITAHGFEASYQHHLYNWLYGELSFMHLSGTKFKNNFQVSSNLEQIENTSGIADRAMLNSVNLKVHLSFINTKKHLLSIYYGPSLYWFNSSTYDEINFNNQLEFWYKNTYGNGIGTVFGFTYLFKLKEKYKIGVDAMLFDNKKRDDLSIVFVNNLSVGILIQRNF